MNWFQVTQCPYFECSGDDITVDSTHVTGLLLCQGIFTNRYCGPGNSVAQGGG